MLPLGVVRDRGVVISGYWMANILNRRYWILSPLLSAGFVMVVLVYTTQAAQLRDIRVGEYESFTRIVFELDTPAAPEPVVSLSSGQLELVFTNTAVELTRKIPVERSQHIKSIQIWNKKSQLSAVLSFDFVRFRHQSFALNNPPRIVLDVQPLDSGPNASAAISPAEPNPNKGKLPPVAESKTSGPFSSKVQESSIAVQETVHADAGVESDNNRNFPISNKNQKTGPATQESGIKNRGKMTSETPIPASVAAPRKPAKQSSRLQFYLVVVLVLITIVILVLLLLMLLSKHRWTDDKSRLNAREFLQSQDKRIASLDARIEEQLKRYEEA